MNKNINIIDGLINKNNNNSNLKNSYIIIFLTFLIFIPILWTIIRSIVFPNWLELINSNEFYNKNSLLFLFYLFEIIFIRVMSPTIASIIIFKKDPKKFLKNRYWILTFFYPLRLILLEIFSFFLIDNLTRSLIVNVIIPIVVLIFYFWKNKILFEEVKINFTRNNIGKFFVIGIFIIFLFILFTYIFYLISLSIGGGIPSNETSLKQLLKSPHSIFILFFTSVIVAPILEEIVFRKTIMDICNNKIWVWPIVAFFFAFAHISNFGDWQNIFVYLPMAIFTSFIYYKFKNLAYPYLLHFGNNLIAFIGYFF